MLYEIKISKYSCLLGHGQGVLALRKVFISYMLFMALLMYEEDRAGS